ncbi:HsdM family class I SAM-dependent methyltransferase [Curtobacterium sp. SAFR-003]|uniref:HsdM family class I SAM-dependent methyltransferase n=1 Tax=Curtobacterium sp. SAFR-003 TaxID=3387276 RepID=UPI003F7D8710
MSEELLQTKPLELGRYSYLKLGNSTLAQLRAAGIVQGAKTAYERKRPDGLVLAPDGAVIAFVEYKSPAEFKTKSQQQKAVQQEIEVAAALCKVYIVTDGQTTLWINPATGNRIAQEDGSLVTDVVDVLQFHPGGMTKERVLAFEALIDKADNSLSAENDVIRSPELLDPAPLAQALWQKIWINTGKEPEKCLYNVVELFVFKFLSDLDVLKSHNNFAAIYRVRAKESAAEALKLYADSSRKNIRELFPKGEDGTTVINGTIFVNEQGAPNVAQAGLFGEVLDQFEAFDKANGSLRHIQRDFKTRLYESFLRQSAGVKALGQYFTPRNVVRAIVKMSSANALGPSARIADPFCGVGGFLLETIVGNPAIYKQFEPKNGAVDPQITIVGYDKGTSEKEDERTIILAKANMLIYFSDLIAQNHTESVLKAFSAGAFNKVFRLLRSNLGTFAQVEDEPYDLILTNPPYVTSGVSSLRKAIEERGLEGHYTSGGRGTESLAMEWIVRNLAPGGQAIVIVPDGLLIQRPMLDFISERCRVQAVISLPTRTFYSTAKKTYVLAVQRKLEDEGEQTDPVFTYLVSEVGESRDNYRFPLEQDDLATAANQFNQYKGSPTSYQSSDPRCKLVSVDDLAKSGNWLADRRWSTEEKAALGIIDQPTEFTEDEFLALVTESQSLLAGFVSEVGDGD